VELLRLGGVMAVAIDDHGASLDAGALSANGPAVARIVKPACRLSNGLLRSPRLKISS
jgi:hypothetical protein